jgi:uncharacterized cupin superfamily protein
VTNVHSGEFVTEASPRSERWTHLDLDSARLGVRVEILEPGEHSSFHHWHTQEEEHVLVLEGTATLVLGPEDAREEIELEVGDHVCFRAGDETAHHLENRSRDPVRFLEFGERLASDVVVYPDAQVMMVKAMDFAQFTYRPLRRPGADGDGD